MFNEQHKKESPILGMLGLGGGIARAGSAGKATSGGTTITAGSYTYHVFLSNDDFNSGADTPGTVDILLIGGGGGGADPIGGGGGGGGVVNATSQSISNFTTYPIVVGAGGGAQPTGGAPGGNSTGLSQTAYGGGGGGGYGETGIPSNASGGGGGADEGTGYSGGTGGPQGNNGGDGHQYYGPSKGYMGGGGGGAGGVGGDSIGGNNGRGGHGGNGTPIPAYPGPVIAPAIPTGTNPKPGAPTNPQRTDFSSAVGPTGLYGGGGGGLNDTHEEHPGSSGGPGGGGAGGFNYPVPGGGQPAKPGVNFTGGGGGGARSGLEGRGAEGMVIIRYTT